MPRLTLQPPAKKPRKPLAKTVQKRRQAADFVTLDGVMTMLCLVVLTRLVVAAIANPAPVAVPGDIVQIGLPTRWAAPQDVIQTRELASPWGQAGAPCRLDIARMARPGGAFSVRAVRADGVMLAWAGTPISCARESVLMSSPDYRTLLRILANRH